MLAVWLYVYSAALTPDKITDTWEVWNSPYMSDAPKVKARACTIEELVEAERLEQEKHAEAEAERLEQRQAMAQAKQAGTIMIEGQQQGDPHHDKMGVYTLVEGKCVNGRGVWTKKGREVEYCMYFANNSEWFISNTSLMEAGTALGWLKVVSAALTPEKISETWKVDDGPGAWLDVSKLKARACSTEEHAALQKEESIAHWQESEGLIVFRRVRGPAGSVKIVDIPSLYTVTFDRFATMAAPMAGIGVECKVYYEFEVLKLEPTGVQQAGFASDLFKLGINQHSSDGVGDDDYR
jgi:hypothetical protein